MSTKAELGGCHTTGQTLNAFLPSLQQLTKRMSEKNALMRKKTLLTVPHDPDP